MKQLSGPELVAMHAADASPSLLLLDVREGWEFDTAAIRLPGWTTRHMPMGSVPTALEELDPLQPVACICHHGVRSAQVVAFLERQGFATVYNLAGGIDAWSTQVDTRVPRY